MSAALSLYTQVQTIWTRGRGCVYSWCRDCFFGDMSAFDALQTRLTVRCGEELRDEWNADVAKAQELGDRSERGELSDEKPRQLLAEL